ncbi:S8 family serine peptidase, partial [Bacillus licheniformis]|uniref:S8 family serine peptidase n=1 Tax=Bacillus licheniformis TaxID=1402 RepID=UPI0028932DEE
MKVFGNDPLYGSTGDHIYVKAFDDAIKLGADVINMSLGSPAGFNEPDSATGKAITNAVENGIVFAISAGNEGSSVGDSRLTPYKPENPDISMVGSPSVYKDST